MPRAKSCTGFDHAALQEVEPCWICLDEGDADNPLRSVCKCPRVSHANCIARWQLQSAGTRKETHCEFCGEELPDWKLALKTPDLTGAPAVMTVNIQHQAYSFEVRPGQKGYKEFVKALYKVAQVSKESKLGIVFSCDDPINEGGSITLKGPDAWDAAVFCAAVSSAKRSADFVRAMREDLPWGLETRRSGFHEGQYVPLSQGKKNLSLRGVRSWLRGKLAST